MGQEHNWEFYVSKGSVFVMRDGIFYEAFNVLKNEGVVGDKRVVNYARVKRPKRLEIPTTLTPKQRREITSEIISNPYIRKIAGHKGQEPYEHERNCHFEGLARTIDRYSDLPSTSLEPREVLELYRRAEHLCDIVVAAESHGPDQNSLNRVMEGLNCNSANSGLQALYSRLKHRPLTIPYF